MGLCYTNITWIPTSWILNLIISPGSSSPTHAYIPEFLLQKTILILHVVPATVLLPSLQIKNLKKTASFMFFLHLIFIGQSCAVWCLTPWPHRNSSYEALNNQVNHDNQRLLFSPELITLRLPGTEVFIGSSLPSETHLPWPLYHWYLQVSLAFPSHSFS